MAIRPHVLYILLAVPYAALLAFLQPPFQVADETDHYMRAVHVSRGELLPTNEGQGSGGRVDVTAVRFLKQFERIPFNTNAKVRRQDFVIADGLETGGEDTYRVFSGTTTYPAFAYAIPAAVIAGARLGRLSQLRTFYAARLANALFAVGVCAGVIMLAPVARWALVGLFLLPMFAAQVASISSDVAIFCLSLLGLALTAHEAMRLRPRWLVLAIAALLITAASAIRPPMIGMLLPIVIVTCFASRFRKRAIVATILTVTSVSGVASWTAFALGRQVDPRIAQLGHVVPGEQISLILHNPMFLLNVAANTVRSLGDFYWRSSIGLLGWLDTPLSWYFYLFATGILVFLVGVACVARDRLPTWLGVTLVASSIVCAALIFASLYLGWTPVGHPTVQGVQGRYFLPLLVPFALAAAGRFPCLSDARSSQGGIAAVGLLYAVSVPHVSWALVSRYYLS